MFPSAIICRWDEASMVVSTRVFFFFKYIGALNSYHLLDYGHKHSIVQNNQPTKEPLYSLKGL